MLRWVHTYLLFWWHTLWQLGKALNNQHGNTNKNIIQTQDINKQTNKQKYHAKSCKRQGYIIVHLKSNTKLSPRHSERSRHCERPGQSGALKKEIWVLLRAPLFLGKWCGVATYFLYQKEKRKKGNTNYMIKYIIVID